MTDCKNQRGTIFIVEDDEDTRLGLAALLTELNAGCQAFDSAESFLEHVKQEPVGCLILDMSLKERSGLDLLRTIRNRGWTLPTMIVSGTTTVGEAMEAVRYGVLDVIEKTVQRHQLMAAVELALAVRPQDCPVVNRDLISKRLSELSDIEKDVLQLLLTGKANKNIAYQLDIGLRSVVRHRKNVLKKLEVESLPQLVRMLTLSGLTDGVPDRRPPSFSLLPQRLRHDLRSKLNGAVINFQLYQLQVRQNQLAEAQIAGARVERVLRELADDPCLVSPTSLVRDLNCVPVVLALFSSPHEGNLFSAVIKLNEYFPEVCSNYNEAIEALMAMNDEPPAFALIETTGPDSDGVMLIRKLMSDPNFETTKVIVISDQPRDMLPLDIQQVICEFAQRPVDAIRLSRSFLNHLVGHPGR